MVDFMPTHDQLKRSAINRLLSTCPPGVPMTSPWLKEQGISPQLLWRYRQSGWLEPLGRGVWIRQGTKLSWQSSVHALQSQLNAQVWPAARSALEQVGQAHYIPQGEQSPLQLCVAGSYRLPEWFRRQPFARNLLTFGSDALFNPTYAGLTEIEQGRLALRASTPERAVLELCHLTPQKTDPEEVMQLLEGLPALRVPLLQSLLLACQSAKAKRLFLVLAETIRHRWLDQLDVSTLDLGAGKRKLPVSGPFNAKYEITVPAPWAEYASGGAN